ncbi:MAG: DUF3089 domain-containing protein [Acidimicrobiales bacterium]
MQRSLAAAILMAVSVLPAVACSSGTSSTAPTTRATSTPTTTAVAYAGYRSVSYDDPAHWLCRPDRDDACSRDLDATVVTADGALTVEPFVPAADPSIDCFYVYPTISRDPGAISDWNASPDEEGFAAYNQVARLRADCRVFAPVYRQRTLASLATRVAGGTTADGADPYDDVLDAWKTYMSEDNHGRGVVLVGHSQGSALLSRLVSEEIDPSPSLRSRLVAAYLAGWAVRVPAGRDVGGDFRHVPLCRRSDQTGCVVTWASFRSTAPPPADAFFGKPREGDDPAACNNPSALAGGSAEPHGYFPANRSASILASLAPDAPGATPWVDPSAGTVTTPFVSLPGLVSTECSSADGFNFLKVTVHGDPADPRADDIGGDLTPEWGLHLVDLNLVMGDVVSLVASQASAWLAHR